MTVPTSSEPPVSLTLGPVTRLTLNRPRRANALDWEAALAFEAALARIAADEETRVVIVGGAGKHFSAGGDFTFIEENTRLGRAEVEARMSRFYAMFLGIVELRVPTLAAISGSAIGAGLCLALACDVRIATDTARFGANFVHLGLHPGMGASVLLPRVVGPGAASELLLTGAEVDAARAFALGLVSAVSAPDQLESTLQRTVAPLLGAPPLTVRETVATLRAPLRQQLGPALAREAACQALDFGSEDVRRAIAAFRSRQRSQLAPR